MKEKVCNVKEESIESKQRVLNLIRQECNGNVEFRIVTGENVLDAPPGELFHVRVLVDQQIVVIRNKVITMNAASAMRPRRRAVLRVDIEGIVEERSDDRVAP